MKNRTALVTGGTSGIGLSIVEHLVSEKYDVYFIGTNAATGKAIEERLAKQTERKVEFIQLDLSNLQDVYRLAQEFASRHEKLDLLANIAGVLLPQKKETVEGIEMSFAVSYLSAYILSTALLPILKASSRPRIVNVGAKPGIVLKGIIDFDEFGTIENYNPFKASTKAVHAKTVMTQILAEQYAAYNITVNSFDPGMVRSQLMREMPAMMRIMTNMFLSFAPKKSKTGIKACTDERLNNISGKLLLATKHQDIAFSDDYKAKLLHATKDILSGLSKAKKPNYKVGWIVPNKLAGLTHYHSEVTQEDIQGIIMETTKIMESINNEFSLIIDNRLMSMEALFTLEQLQNQSPLLKHKHLKYIIVIVPNHLKAFANEHELQQANGVTLKNATTVSDAFDFLTRSKFVPAEAFFNNTFLKN